MAKKGGRLFGYFTHRKSRNPFYESVLDNAKNIDIGDGVERLASCEFVDVIFHNSHAKDLKETPASIIKFWRETLESEGVVVEQDAVVSFKYKTLPDRPVVCIFVDKLHKRGVKKNRL